MRAIGFEIDGYLRDAAAHGGFGHSGGFPHQHARIERLRDEILTAKLQTGHTVGATHGIRDVFLGKISQSMCRSQLHLFVNGGGTHVERSAENKRESENVVDLVRIVGASGGDDDVGAGGLGFFVGNFRIGIRHSENDRVGGHGADHILVEGAFDREPRENIRANQRFGQGAQRRVLHEAVFIFVHATFAAFVDDALGVAEDDVLALHAQSHIVLGAGDSGRSGAVEDHAHFAYVFTHHFESIQQGRARNYRGPVLVVMEDWDLHRLAQFFFDLEAVGGFDVFEVDAAERGFEQLAELDNLFGIFAVHFDVEDVDIGKAFEQDRFAFHDGLSGESSNVAEAEHGGAVAQDCDQIATACVLEGILGILLNFETGLGDAGCIGQAEIALRAAGLGRRDFNFSRALAIVIIQCLLLAD